MLRRRSAVKKRDSLWNLKAIILESFFIVLAVLIALWVNGWWQERENRQLVDRILESARQEIQENLSFIDETLSYRSTLLSDLRAGRHVVTRIPGFAEEVNFYDLEALEKRLQELFLSESRTVDLLNAGLYAAGEKGYWLNHRGNTLNLRLDGTDLIVYGSGNLSLRPAYVTDTVWQTANASNALIHMDYDLLTQLSEIYSIQATYRETTLEALNLVYTGTGASVISAMDDMHYFERQLKEKYLNFLEKTER